MNVDHYKTILRAKERELTDEMARLRNEALDTKTADVEDPIDAVTTAINQGEVSQEGEIVFDTLTMVRDALRRIEKGTYGICIECGEAIGPARLDALPWTPYCLEDQEKLDRIAAERRPQTLGDIA